MSEEQRLISIGFPLEDALTLCHSLRKEGGLEQFICDREAEYREICRQAVDEIMG